jgi:hypothetical protein
LLYQRALRFSIAGVTLGGNSFQEAQEEAQEIV